jgi:sec-independent protein translocase protein TatB
MFSIAHIAIIFVVVLVVFGPEKLPELARNFGKIMGEFRRATGELRGTFEGHMRDLEREADLRAARQKAADPAVMTPLPAAPEGKTDPADATAGTSAASGPGATGSPELPPAPNFVAADGTVATKAPYSTALREPVAEAPHQTASLPFDEPAQVSSSSDHDSATAPLLAPDDHKVTDGRSGAA